MMLARRIFLPGMSWSLAPAAGIGLALALAERLSPDNPAAGPQALGPALSSSAMRL